jgi:ELWxxDGT repeat protein
MVEYNNEMYFVASTDFLSPRFWKTDGTAVGTKSLANSIDTTLTHIYNPHLTLMGNKFFFPGEYKLDNSHWLWAFDGNSSKRITKIGNESFYFDGNYSYKAFNSYLYFNKITNGYLSTIWRTDGTEGGTKQISNEVFAANVIYKTLNNALYFISSDTSYNIKLWKINDNGTINLVKVIYPKSEYAASDYIFTLIEWNNKLYFMGNDGINGTEIWSSDGTEQGTKMVADINKGAGSSIPYNFCILNNNLFFVANDGIVGAELWKMSTTGILETAKDNYKITLYPNPSQDILTIKNEEKEDFKRLKIYNLQGELLKNTLFTGKATTINVHDLTVATYILVLENDTKSVSKKFIKVQ